MIYIRPGNLFKDFIVETNVQEIDSKGRVVIKHTGDGKNFLSGCLADATDQDRANHNIPDHIVTHTIVQKGYPIAKRTDKLILENRVFYVVDIDDSGALGIATLYYVEERRDLR